MLQQKYMNVLNEVPNFTTDEKAEVKGKSGNRIYKYLNLATILKTIKPVFNKYELGFYQAIKTLDDKTGTVETIIFDDQDTLTVGSYPFVIVGDPQAMGSAVTYARRYSLYAALGIFPDKDDDGAEMKQYVQNPQQSSITPEIGRLLNDMAKNHNVRLLEVASQVTGRKITRMREISMNEAADIKRTLENMQ